MEEKINYKCGDRVFNTRNKKYGIFFEHLHVSNITEQSKFWCLVQHEGEKHGITTDLCDLRDGSWL